MTGPLLFVDLSRPATPAPDPATIAQALGIDAYRARMLLTTGAPFLAHGFPDLQAAARTAALLVERGIPASAHSQDAIKAVPDPVDAKAFQESGASFALIAGDGSALPVAVGAVRCLVQGKISVELITTVAVPSRPRIGIGGMDPFRDTRAEPDTARSERAFHRLEVWLDEAGRTVRFGIRADAFDYSALGPRKTLAAIRNLAALRDAIARAAGGAPVDELFHRTELARSGMHADEWEDGGIGAAIPGVPRGRQAVRSNRAAFDLYSRVRFLHALRGRPDAADHYLEL